MIKQSSVVTSTKRNEKRENTFTNTLKKVKKSNFLLIARRWCRWLPDRDRSVTSQTSIRTRFTHQFPCPRPNHREHNSPSGNNFGSNFHFIEFPFSGKVLKCWFPPWKHEVSSKFPFLKVLDFVKFWENFHFIEFPFHREGTVSGYERIETGTPQSCSQ